MTALLLDPQAELDLIRQRQHSGADRFDEVWNGVYIMSPSADNEHQHVNSGIAAVCWICIDLPLLGRTQAGVNVSDRDTDWTKNYRVPDTAVFLTGTPAENRRTHWFGGPDFAAEVSSDNDRTWEKVPFYDSIGTRELLIVDRDPWQLTLFKRVSGRLERVGQSTFDDPQPLRGEVVPVTWRLIRTSDSEPKLEIRHHDGVQLWTISPD